MSTSTRQEYLPRRLRDTHTIDYRLSRLRWLFFDVGSVLMDETLGDEQTRKQIVRLLALRGIRVPLVSVRTAWDAAVATYESNLMRGALHRLVDRRTAEAVFEELRPLGRPTPPYTEARPTLDVFSKRYGVGIIANQPSTLKQWASIAGFAESVHQWFLSSELGFGKPDTRIYRYALERVACDAKEAAMIGDRLDYDIAPAKRAGMLAIRLRRGPHAIQEPRSRDEIPDLTIATLTTLCRRICAPPESSMPLYEADGYPEEQYPADGYQDDGYQDDGYQEAPHPDDDPRWE